MVSLASFYFAYEILFVFPKLATQGEVLFNTVLIGAEILCAMFSIYLYHSVFCATEWKHPRYKGIASMSSVPFVTIQIPTFNEPVRVLAETINACKRQDYPKDRYKIVVADDSTDAMTVKRIHGLCRKKGVVFVHRNHRRGFKAGALNDAEARVEGDVIALLDADDMPEPSFLAHCVEVLMSDSNVAFVQTRNAERNDRTNTITGIGRMIRDLFFGAIMKSKDMRKLGIFCGSGGVIRRRALRQMGGWPEETVTEDIDLSTKLFASGYISKYINPVECRGLLPTTFTGLAGQTFRWAHGTTHTLLLRWRMILRIPSKTRKLEHLLSCSTYVLGPAILAIDLLMVAHLLFRIPIFHMYEPWSIWIFGVGFTLSSFSALLFVQMADEKISMKRLFMYIFAVYGLAVNFTIAAASAFIGRKSAFFRTPRSAGRKDYVKLMGRYWIEALIGLVSLYAGLTSLTNPVYNVQATWVIFFGVGFLTAPILALKYG